MDVPLKAKLRAKGRLHRAFCKNVKERRLQLGLTQQEVADAMGITHPAYCVLESGKASPTLTTIERVAAVLKISPVLLFAAEELAAA
jgi:transcriptional regulator with XRE-family HTH domain